MECEACDMRRVLITHIGLVQIVDVPPAIMADKMCVIQCCLISGEPLRGLVIILHLFLGGNSFVNFQI